MTIGYHQAAAEFLAAAASSLFPNTLLLGGQGTTRYFFYDFLFPFDMQEEALRSLEERMARLLKTHKTIAMREMLAANAGQLFIARGQPKIAEKLASFSKEIVQVCAIGDFVDYCPYPCAEEFPCMAAFKLFDTQDFVLQGKRGVRIIGVLAEDKRKLKALLKILPSPSSLNHTRFISESKLFLPLEEGVWMWLPKAECVKEVLLQRWRAWLVKQNFKCISSPSPLSSNELNRYKDLDKVAEIACAFSDRECDQRNGLLETKKSYTDRFVQFFLDENFLQACISSLQFILEMPKILGFEFQIALALSAKKEARYEGAKRTLRAALKKEGLSYSIEKSHQAGSVARIEVRLPDALGRLWSGPFMSVHALKNGKLALVCSAFGTMERLVGLILERYAGGFPAWLSPEQVRFLPINEEARQYAGQVHHILMSKGIRSEIDLETSDLKSRVYRAILEKIPYAVIIGSREVNAQTLVVRTLGSEREECMNVDELCDLCIKQEWTSEPENQ